jgi:hypothetical protein
MSAKMTTTSGVLRKLAEDDGNYIELDLSATPRMVMKDINGQVICTVPNVQFDDLRDHSYLEQVNNKWRLTHAGKKAARR